jgi:hypothetical protein
MSQTWTAQPSLLEKPANPRAADARVSPSACSLTEKAPPVVSKSSMKRGTLG